MRFKVLLIAPMLLLVALLAAACSSNAASSEGSGHEADPVTVKVETGDFYIKSAETTFKVGVPYHFVLTNAGKIAHEVMLMPVVEPSSGMTMKEMDEMALGMVEEEGFPAGATGTFDVTFTKPYGPRELELACHIAGHYEAGMHAAITVVVQ